uniref:Chromosome 16 open reading frame 72 n=1 Tax=Anser cygnoides TaxID=8845 RepID=A0A8B9DDP6_ANSCY
GAGPIVRRGLRAGAGQSASPAGCGRCRRCARCPGPGRSRSALPGPAPELPSEGGTKWRNLTWPFGVGDSKINSVCPSLPADRVCQQPGLSLWVPFQNAATAVTNLYKESVDAHQRSFDVGIQIGYQRRNKDVLAWVKKRRRTIRREDLISFLCGKVPPPRNTRAPPRLTVVSPNRATSTETSSSVETDLQPFREAIALHDSHKKSVNASSFALRITERPRWEGTSEDHPVQPPVEQDPLEHLAQDGIQVGFEYLQRRLHNLSGQPVPVLCHSPSKEVPPHIGPEPPGLQFVLVASPPVAGHN